MSEEKKIFWIASYPKSGNTLFRAILSSLFFTNDGVFTFKLFDTIKIFESASRFLFLKDENNKDFKKINELEILSKYWLEAQSQKRLNIKESFVFLKTHSALLNLYGHDFTNPQYSRGLVYLVRDPRDIAISWSKHMNKSIDETIKCLINKDFVVQYNNLEYLDDNIIPMCLLSRWDVHVKSWQYLNVPKMIIRYEDLISNKKEIILKVIKFFEENYKFTFNSVEEKINNIVLTTNFENMKKTEEKEGFEEAKEWTNFFSVGKKNQWKDKLSLNQIKKIEENFKNAMINFKYL
ncbi:sulfotransferase domain-containing protein [Alphaproteobacteria bacterium]|nr:sulfotransferase domain-containing protein [Alphaproteobacteria bacterium]